MTVKSFTPSITFGNRSLQSKTASKNDITDQAAIVVSVNGENIISTNVPENKAWNIVARLTIEERDV